MTGDERLRKGEVILFPTDTVLGIGCLLGEECVKRLEKITKRPKNKPFAMLLSEKKDIIKWVLEIPQCYHRLSRFLPGPLTLIFKGKNSLPIGVLSEYGTVGIRIPDYKEVQDLIRDADTPLIATSANISGNPTPLFTEEVGLEYDRVIPGKSGSGIPSTVLNISGKKPVLLRRGMISIIEIENAIEEEVLLAKGVPIHILYVCSANICRSPIAEAHMKLLTRDFENIEVRSAGTMALSGVPISIGARAILEEKNIETHHLSAHVAKPILDGADIIFVMEEEHKDYLNDLLPKNKGKILFLRNFKDESETFGIEDPIGRGIDKYREVYSEIERANKRVEAYLRRKFE